MQKERINRCFIYGTAIPYKFIKEWKNNIDDEINKELLKNNIEFNDYDGRDGKYVIVGKKIKRSSNDIFSEIITTVPELPQIEIFNIKSIIKKCIPEWDGDFHYYFIVNFI